MTTRTISISGLVLSLFGCSTEPVSFEPQPSAEDYPTLDVAAGVRARMTFTLVHDDWSAAYMDLPFWSGFEPGDQVGESGSTVLLLDEDRDLRLELPALEVGSAVEIGADSSSFTITLGCNIYTATRGWLTVDGRDSDHVFGRFHLDVHQVNPLGYGSRPWCSSDGLPTRDEPVGYIGDGNIAHGRFSALVESAHISSAGKSGPCDPTVFDAPAGRGVASDYPSLGPESGVRARLTWTLVEPTRDPVWLQLPLADGFRPIEDRQERRAGRRWILRSPSNPDAEPNFELVLPSLKVGTRVELRPGANQPPFEMDLGLEHWTIEEGEFVIDGNDGELVWGHMSVRGCRSWR